MQICEYFFENACYSVTKYYLCKQNNKRSLLGRKQQHQVVRSFPNRYLFSLTNKVTYLFPISCILEIILCGYKLFVATLQEACSEMVMLETAIQSCFNVVSYGAKHTTYTIRHTCKKR